MSPSLRPSRGLGLVSSRKTSWKSKPGFMCTSSRMPGNHIHGNGLPATFVPGRRNVCEGYWAVDES